MRDRSVAPSSTLDPGPVQPAIPEQAFYGHRSREPWRQVTYAAGFPALGQSALGAYVKEQLDDLLRLEAGWDDGRARPITEASAMEAMRIVFGVANDESLPPQLFPLVDGGLQLEWHADRHSIEIEIDADGQSHFLAVNGAGEILVDEEEASSNVEDLRGLTKILLERLSRRVHRAS